MNCQIYYMIWNKDKSWTLEVVRKMYELNAIRILENLKTMMKYSKIIFNDNIKKISVNFNTQINYVNLSITMWFLPKYFFKLWNINSGLHTVCFIFKVLHHNNKLLHKSCISKVNISLYSRKILDVSEILNEKYKYVKIN